MKSEYTCVVNVGTVIPSLFTICEPNEAKAEKQKAEKDALDNVAMYDRYMVSNPENKQYWQSRKEAYAGARYTVMRYEEFQKKEREAVLSIPPKRITAEVFEHMLNVLPPLHWETHNGVEEFCMSEMLTGSYTDQFARVRGTDEYYSKVVDSADRSTWIHNFVR